MKSNLPSEVSLLDFMAAHALIGLLSNPDITKMMSTVLAESQKKVAVPELAAMMAYEAAKCMMIERDKEGTP